MLSIAILAALILDAVFGEPRRWHPLVGFGRLAVWLERRSNIADNALASRLLGLFALLLLLLPACWLAWQIDNASTTGLLVSIVILYFCLGLKSLGQHAQAVQEALDDNELVLARQKVSYMVSRNTTQLDQEEIAKATVESVLENGNDAVFATLFWFAVFGPMGALAYRISNTLDAMWGYRNARFHAFGWAAARWDDALNYIPARLTALSYALIGKTTFALQCWKQQARHCKSPNGGPVMASGAGALQIRLGGPTVYENEWVNRPLLGGGKTVQPADISRAIKLVQQATLLWLLVISLLQLVTHA